MRIYKVVYQRLRAAWPVMGLALLLLVAACATPVTMAPQGSSQEVREEALHQQIFVLQQNRQDITRLERLAYPLRTKNVDLCGTDVTGIYGVTFWNMASVPAASRQAARELGVTDRPSIFVVSPGSPAARAGLKKDDELIFLNGTQLRTGRAGMQDATRAMIQAAKARAPLEVVFMRKGKEGTVALRPIEACAYPVVLTGEGMVNAFADGDSVFITNGMMRFARNDNELALVVAHELAHNAMNHVGKKQQNALAAGLVGLLLEGAVIAAGGSTNGSIVNQLSGIGAGAHSVAFEQEADYVGMYMMARAGFDVTGVERFWRRMAAEVSPGSINAATTHPTSPARFIAIQKTADEIARKKSAGQVLKPNLQ